MSKQHNTTSQEIKHKTDDSELLSARSSNSYKNQSGEETSNSQANASENQDSLLARSMELVASHVLTSSTDHDLPMEIDNIPKDYEKSPINRDQFFLSNSLLKRQSSLPSYATQSNDKKPILYNSLFSSGMSNYSKHPIADSAVKSNRGDLINPNDENFRKQHSLIDRSVLQSSLSRRQIFSSKSFDESMSHNLSPPHTPPGSPETGLRETLRFKHLPLHQFKSTENKHLNPISNIDDMTKFSSQHDSIVAYITSLASYGSVNQRMKSIIMHHLYNEHQLQVIDIKCSSQLDAGIVYLKNENDKHYLIHNIKNINIGTSSIHTVSFVAELELVSYVVIESKDIQYLPSTNEVAQKWMKTYYGNRPIKCERLHDEFSNIFRIVSNRFDEIINHEQRTEFSIDTKRANVYFRADCCFLENLPATFNESSLKNIIAKQIAKETISDKSIYIQYNKTDGNAVVLTCDEARPWASFRLINFNGKYLIKNDRFGYQIRLSNVPESISISLVEKCEIFANTEIKAINRGNDIIIEIFDKSTFHKCLKQRYLLIDNYSVRMEAYSSSNNYEDWEINAKNWYETQMSTYESNIMEFMIQPEHPIFQFQWNPEAFLEQFNRWQTTNDQCTTKNQQEYKNKLSNKQRHLLRVTVMLNTIGILKKGSYYVGRKMVQLKSIPSKAIVYNHQSKLRCAMMMPLSNPVNDPKKTTLVTVINQDCLVAYENFVSKGYHPLLLNMANAFSPGGGYRRGDGAQEENIFRRSNYYQNLDMDLDYEQSTERFYCLSNCQLTRLLEHDRMYPMDEFGAIYTSGLTVFRHPENMGYALMERPLYDVCAIAIAAYRNPKLDSHDRNCLSMKYSIRMRKKIENMFAIAYHHNHNCLILSAFGCGAFRNPPKHIANIFKSVIEQYAGFFEHICFAIIDDHNAGLEFNPEGNFRPFQEVLDNLKVTPTKQETPGMKIGPWEIINSTNSEKVTLDDIRIYRLPLCRYGAQCRDLDNRSHCREYQHPPLCSYVNSSKGCAFENSSDHMLWFRHRIKSSHGKTATSQMINSSIDPNSNFNDDDQQLRVKQKHVSNSKNISMDIDDNQTTEYNVANRSIIREINSSLPICSFTPFHCQKYSLLSESRDIRSLPFNVREHCREFLHVCRFGSQCREKSSEHSETTIHVARNVCPYNNKCTKLHQEDHLNSLSHIDIADIRHICTYQAYECRDFRKPEHIIRYRHLGNYDESSVIPYSALNKQTNFVLNQQRMLTRIHDYALKLPTRTSLSITNSIVKFIRQVTPTYQCSTVIFELILTYGYVMSDKSIEKLQMPSFLIQRIQKHKKIQAIIDLHKNQSLADHVNNYVKAIVFTEQSKREQSTEMIMTRQRIALPDEDFNITIREEEKFLIDKLNRNEIDIIRRCTSDMIQMSLDLRRNSTRIRKISNDFASVDKCIRTIVGPQLRLSDEDIVIVFNRKVMHHPDANFSIQSKASYFDKTVSHRRPWIQVLGDGNEQFQKSKLHCSILGYECAAAAELMAIAGLEKRIVENDLAAIIRYMSKYDSNIVFEGHLPDFIPLDYIDEIYIPKNIFQSLSPAAQRNAKSLFHNTLHITHHEVNLNSSLNRGEPQALQRNRVDYQQYVIDKLIQVSTINTNHSEELRGIVVTLPPSDFREHIQLPFTILQLYDLYINNQKSDCISNDIYIYWKAMYGDMMLTLSNKPLDGIEDREQSQSLICYVAEIPSTTTTDYKESYSYLNLGNPSQHFDSMTRHSFLAYSNTFHRGCNIDGFLVYCLKIERDTSLVTFSHAGPNSIYNNQTISCKFLNFKLNDLNFIHVSAGSQRVPIQNLMVCFRPVVEQHPLFDQDFKPSCPDRVQSAIVPKAMENNVQSNSSRTNQRIARSSAFHIDRRALDPCQDSINCLQIASEDHCKRYYHPCRFAEVCRNQDKEPHLTHERRRVETCPSNTLCKLLYDPYHRAKYRHSNLPDFLIPCRDQKNCKNHLFEHRIRYSHGEKVEWLIKEADKVGSRSSSKSLHSEDHSEGQYSPRHQQHPKEHSDNQNRKQLCRYGSSCRDQTDVHHCSRYSHSSKNEVKPSLRDEVDSRLHCQFGSACYNSNCDHKAKYSHFEEQRNRPVCVSNCSSPACPNDHQYSNKDRSQMSKYSS